MSASTTIPAESLVGKSLTRVGGRDRVTGAQRYIADIKLDGALHVKLVTLPVGHARIISIDTSLALQVTGVSCVITAADLKQPVPRFGPSFNDRPVLAVDEVKYYGEPLAAVAAEDEDAAEEAARLVQVEYEELPGVYSVERALASDAPLVQAPSLRGNNPLAHTNIINEWKLNWGNVDTAKADLVLENTYTFPMISHFAIEPFAFMASAKDGGITVWSPIQHPFVMQRIIAHVTDLPLSAVRIIAPDPGGAFGGKAYPKFEPLLALMALKTGRPVRLVLNLEESFQASRRASSQVWVRSGFDHQGMLVFQDIRADFMLGAYVDIGDRVVSKAAYTAAGPYRNPNARILARSLFSHTTPSTAFRGFGVPQVSWAIESQINQAAEKLGLDGLEIRLRNVGHKGELVIPGGTPVDGHWEQTLQKAADAIDWGTPLPSGRGRGLSMGMKPSATVLSSNALARLHMDGSLSLMMGTSDMGQGARTVFVQLAASELEVPPEKVQITMGDTSIVPFDSSTSASRSTVFMGNAVRFACQDIQRKLKEIASEQYGVAQEEIQIFGGMLHFAGRSLPYTTVLKDYFGPGRGEIIGLGTTRARFEPEHPLGGNPAFWELVAVGCEAEVDTTTGEITIHKLATVTDVGKAINPQQVEMQDAGAAIMGLGHTLMEHLILDDHGRLRNAGALDYRIPTIKDMPGSLHSGLVENQDGPGPFGAKGAGESGILSISGAVGAAVSQATGVIIRDLPLTPERVWLALQDKANINPSAIHSKSVDHDSGIHQLADGLK